MTERDYLISLCSFIPFGPARINLLAGYYGSAKNAWNASAKELISIGLNAKTVEQFIDYRSRFDQKDYFARLKKLSIDIVTKEDRAYPVNLKDLPDSPIVLYVRGVLKESDVNAIAIVGSRKMTSYGRDVAKKFATELGNLGITIVSGLAFGVDYAAHQACLETGGRCIAVLAGGVDYITPRTNEWLGKKIISSGGAVVSEFPPGTIPQRYFFPEGIIF